jgi:hypothetical protein
MSGSFDVAQALASGISDRGRVWTARPDLVANQDPLLLPHEMFVHDECGGVLVFRSENQGCAF